MSEILSPIPNSINETTARFARIDARPRRRRRSGWTRERQILAEIGKLIQARHHGPCDSDEGGIYLRAALPSIAKLSGGLDAEAFTGRIEAWARIAVPRMDAAELAEGIAEAQARNERDRLFWTAADLGDLINLTTAEREHLGIRTIRPGGMTPAEFERYRRSRKTAGRQTLRRAAAAVTPPAPISIESAQPWQSEGISRRTWFRRRKAAIAAENGTATAVGTDPVANRSEGSPIATEAVPPAQTRPLLVASRVVLDVDPVWAKRALKAALGTSTPAAQRTHPTGLHRSSRAMIRARAISA